MVNLERGRVYRIDYACPTPGPEVEEGTVEGFWTGEIDTWGKHTIRPIDGSAPFYLFAGEIVNAEPLCGEA